MGPSRVTERGSSLSQGDGGGDRFDGDVSGDQVSKESPGVRSLVVAAHAAHLNI